MEFDSNKSIAPQLVEFNKLSEHNGNFLAKVLMYGQDANWRTPKQDDKRKVGWKEVQKICCQATGLSQVETLEILYTNAKRIMEDATISKQDKFDILFGDIELLFEASATDFKKKHDLLTSTISDTSITGIRERYGIV